MASVLSLAAGAAAFVPALVRAHRQPALSSLFPGTTTVYRVPLAGGRPRPVLRVHGQWGFPVATADGSALLLERPTETRGTDGWRVTLTSPRGWSRRMPFPLGVAAASPDGTRVAAVRMHLLELVTPRNRRLLARDASSSAPVWTRDGRSLVYVDTSSRVVVRDLATGTARVLARGRYFDPAVSAEGRGVYLLGLNEAVSIPK